LGFVQKQLKDLKQDNYIEDQNLLYELKAENEKGSQDKAQFEKSAKKRENETKRALADQQALFQL